MMFTAIDYTIFFVLVGLTIIAGFLGAKWRAPDFSKISEWSIGGMKFGTVIVWFLMGADIYTAYSLVAIPGSAYALGGFILYAVVYGSISYPFLYIVATKFYRIAKRRGYITAGDYVRDRFDSRILSLLISLTGIIAMLPYIALQIVGIRYVLDAMGFPVIPSFIIAYIIVAAFVAISGLRGPALSSLIKDVLLWAVILTIVIALGIRFTGFGPIFSEIGPSHYLIPSKLMLGYITLAFASGISWLLFPNLLVGLLGSKSEEIIRKNSIFLPLYQVWLILLAIMGLVALAKNLVPHGISSLAFPSVISAYFPSYFVALAFAGIVIGSMVPAGLQSLGAANLIARNIYVDFINKRATEKQQVLWGRVSVFIMIIASLIFAITPAASGLIFYLLTFSYAWLLQTLPAIILSMYWYDLDKYSVAAGWAVGTVFVTYGLATVKFSSSLLPWFYNIYVGFLGLVLNLVVMLVVYAVVKALKVKTTSKLTPQELM
ncbi:sodium:solute symporter family protein [Vulcanisaeta distributa]|uniref:Na+/solute symporter n=1 Tax=Vulcanisaeta distributa (strain DSM 14429 / JCM 11212 / NBRC 100878 / IC-017) TaxID=572478 RepID=E1QTI9_VULDI|nr:sodium:proton antiporter [Vulcanisaeta distributa]ADN49704.1 Na+/solute symporter [Vulcanisaeta distributa DSM 14429]